MSPIPDSDAAVLVTLQTRLILSLADARGVSLSQVAAAELALNPDAAPGPDGLWPRVFARDLDRRARQLRLAVLEGRYRPGPLRRVSIPKKSGGERVLGIPNVVDRLLQRALLDLVTPAAERGFDPRSFGYRPGRGAAQAVRHLLGATGVRARLALVKRDVYQLFDRIPHAVLRERIDALCPDPLWRHLQDLYLLSWPTAPGCGVPQGAPLSALLANLVLDHHLDRPLAQARPGLEAPVAYVRYADDLLLVTDRVDGAPRLVLLIEGLLHRAGLRLGAGKVEWSTSDQGLVPFPVLGRSLRFHPEVGGWSLREAELAPWR